jgi:hypothetical protein
MFRFLEDVLGELLRPQRCRNLKILSVAISIARFGNGDEFENRSADRS